MRPLLLVAGLLGTALLLLVFVFPAQLAEAGLALERARSGLSEHSVTVDGLQIRYLDSGGSGEPLVLVHGFGADKDNWTRVARWLTPHYRVIAPDLPGYGESDAPAGASYRVPDQAVRLQAFIGTLGLGAVHLGGSSMGGHIIGTYAARDPQAVKSLWLVASGGVFSAPLSEMAQTLASGGENPLVATDRASFDRTLAYVFTEVPRIPGVVREVLAARAAASRALRAEQFRQIREESPGLEGLLTGLTIPTHILWGDQDRVLHVGAVGILQARLPQASATVLPGVGHLPMMEQPEVAARDYLAFRDRLAGG
ncbi:MAG TPA: alpha/beta fold hydrolase [Nevskiaceae bacterium]|nr:alpha/beta fold hydrolase [Nevskiaceae bacterium]